MAALIFIIISEIKELYELSKGLHKSFNVLKTLQNNRNKLLFERYCRDLARMEIAEEAFEFLEHERNSAGMVSNRNYDEIEILQAEEVRNSTFFDDEDPELIYANESLGQITEGVSFTISGTTLSKCERFSINLVLDNNERDIALHFNPRLPQNYIVRNCKVKKIWSTEEVASTMPFVLERGKKFTIQILVTDEEYLISVNGHHFTAYRHRLPYRYVKCLEVKGDVKDIELVKTNELEYPKRIEKTIPIKITSILDSDSSEFEISKQVINFDCNQPSTSHAKSLKLPYYAKLPDKFKVGQQIIIEGRIKILPHSFYINLQSGNNIWPHPVIAFHLNPRFAADGKRVKHFLCKNSWFDGKWQQEERTQIADEFAPGRNFRLGFFANENCYDVYLNQKLIANYYYRIELNKVDTVYIQGDVHIWNVALMLDTNQSRNSEEIDEILRKSSFIKQRQNETKWV